jgi:p-hydroxybenzoate 3-monooxygenase
LNVRTSIGIIGAGPAGLFLGLLLNQAGIHCVILEHRSREYVESRARAGLLEQNTVDLIDELHIAHRLHKEGLKHHGVNLSFEGCRIRVPFDELTGGRCITIYGQQEVIKDLVNASLEKGIQIYFDAQAATIQNINGNEARIGYTMNGEENLLTCDFIAGCDGYHGISRKSMPAGSFHEFVKEYPFSWLGILAHAVPATGELIYAYHENGFALHSLRSHAVSRLYLQVSNNENLNDWSDKRIWDELNVRLTDEQGFNVNRGEIFEKAITPMRSFMIDHMQSGRLFIAGDAAHIVPPTGGKGLNLAVADVRILAAGFIAWYRKGEYDLLENYSQEALRRIWRAQDFSNFMTYLFHKQADHGSFDYHLQKARFNYIGQSKAMATTIAENYVGLRNI